MDLVFVTEARFYKNSSGQIYADSASFSMILWERYLSFFDKLYILARVGDSDTHTSNLIDDSRICFLPIPYYVGFEGFLKRRNEILQTMKSYTLSGRAYICRVPGQIGQLFANQLKRKKIAYAVEVVGDPWDVFAPGSINHPLSPIMRIGGYWGLHRVVKTASAVLYVTKQQLQRRYPCRKGVFSTFASNVFINNSFLVSQPKKYSTNLKNHTISFLAIGSLEQMYKAPDIILDALAILKKKGYQIKLKWLGDGMYKQAMQEYAHKLCLDTYVDFAGNVSSQQVHEELLCTDIFLHVSRTEGLPRALIEAMACSLPCIGSRVGGIPELLEEVALVSPGIPSELAEKIQEFISNTHLLNSQAFRNWNEAQTYHEIFLSQRRTDFYQYVTNIVEQ